MKKINILMVGPRCDVKGGITSVVNSFLNYDFKEAFKIYYVPTFIERGNIKKIVYFIFSLLKILFVLGYFNISIIHVHVSERGSFSRKYIIFKLGKLFRKKIIIHMHGAEFKQFYAGANNKRKKIIIKFLKGADQVIVLGTGWNEYVKTLDNEINTIILRNSIKVISEKAYFCAVQVNILFLAVLTIRKGIFDLIESANILLQDKELKRQNIKFIIAGDGKENARVKKYVNDLNLTENFQFMGWVKDVVKKDVLIKSQILVLPSYNEGLPMSILDGMSYGLPIVATNVGDICDAVKNNINGYIIEPGDIKGLCDGIKSLIINKDIWNKFSTNSKKIILDDYNEKNYFCKIEELYHNLSSK